MRRLLFICCITFIVSCDTYDFIDLINECDAEIACDYSLDTTPIFPSVNHTDYYISNSIEKGKSNRFTKSGSNGWKRFIDESPRKRLSIFIYQTDSIRKYESIDSLKFKGLYNRIDYSVSDLEKLGYEIHICDKM